MLLHPRLDRLPIDLFEGHAEGTVAFVSAFVRQFSGRYITVTRWADGSYHPNFRPMPMREDLTLERYALGVYNELCMALGGLVEE